VIDTAFVGGETANALDNPTVVLDTNIVLDVWLYQDPATPELLAALQQRQIQRVATHPMREELSRV